LIASDAHRWGTFSRGLRRENAIVKTNEPTMITALRTRLPGLHATWMAAFAGLCLAGTTGCGGFFYALSASDAASKIETAHALGAEKYAPYEYYYAYEHLQKAMEEAASADYGDAMNFAEDAEKYADKAILLSKQAHEGSGR
jgi:hypothetical protein